MWLRLTVAIGTHSFFLRNNFKTWNHRKLRIWFWKMSIPAWCTHTLMLISQNIKKYSFHYVWMNKKAKHRAKINGLLAIESNWKENVYQEKKLIRWTKILTIHRHRFNSFFILHVPEATISLYLCPLEEIY